MSPPIALVLGIAFGFMVEHPYRAESTSLAKFLLQASVIGLGFGMDLHQVSRRAARDLCTRHQHQRWPYSWDGGFASG